MSPAGRTWPSAATSCAGSTCAAPDRRVASPSTSTPRPRPVDGYDAVEWLAAQPWCTGAVGMWGISYGGFTSIQVAKLRPPHLRAIVPVQATDDRYLTDVHYIGGCVTASELSQYAVSQVAMNAMPPDPAIVGEGWRAAWAARLEATPPWLFDVAAPAARRTVLAVPARWRRTTTRSTRRSSTSAAGWTPTWTRPCGCRPPAARRRGRSSATGSTACRRRRRPGPNLDELHEIVRFFDRWLKGIPNGADEEPAVVWFEREYAEPEPFPAALPGRWRAATSYPHPAVEPRTWAFASGAHPLVGRLVDGHPTTPPASTAIGTGRRSGPGRRCRGAPAARPTAWPGTSDPTRAWAPRTPARPCASPLEILGVPEVVLHLATSATVATAVVRLTDVAPDGTSAQVSAGDPEPHPPALARAPRAPRSPAGSRRFGCRSARLATGSSPVTDCGCRWPRRPGRSSGPRRRRRRSSCGMGGPPRRASSSRSCRPPAGRRRAGRPSSRPARRSSSRSVARVAADSPIWQIRDDVIDGSVTVTIHDGGEDLLEDGRRLYSAETLRLTAWRRRPGPRQPVGRRGLSLARAHVRHRDPGAFATDERRVGLRPAGRPRGRPRRRAVLPSRVARVHSPPPGLRGSRAARAGIDAGRRPRTSSCPVRIVPGKRKILRICCLAARLTPTSRRPALIRGRILVRTSFYGLRSE